MRIRSFANLLPVLALAACGPAPEPVTPKEPTPPTVASGATPSAAPAAPQGPEVRPSADFDPVSVGMSVDGAKRLCDDHLKAAQALVDRIKTLKGAAAPQLTYDAVLGRFDDVALEVDSAAEFNQLTAVAHPDA